MCRQINSWRVKRLLWCDQISLDSLFQKTPDQPPKNEPFNQDMHIWRKSTHQLFQKIARSTAQTVNLVRKIAPSLATCALALVHLTSALTVAYTVVPRFTNHSLYEPSGLCFLGPLCEPNLLYKPKSQKKRENSIRIGISGVQLTSCFVWIVMRFEFYLMSCFILSVCRWAG
jgi:hypothetical protein